MVNPYASPQFESASDPPAGRQVSPQERGLVGHVRVVGILQMVQGALDMAAGLALIGMAVFLVYYLEGFTATQEAMQEEMDPNSPLLSGRMNTAGIVYGVVGVIAVLIGMLSIFAGYCNLYFRGQLLGYISLTVGLGTVLTCYCAPTSLALFVYGLVVYLNPSVTAAFRLGSSGYTAQQIEAAFPRRR